MDFQDCFIFILLPCLFIFFFFIFFKKPKNGFDLPPSPPLIPTILRHTHLLLYYPVHKILQKLSSEYGPLLHFHIPIFNTNFLLVSSASLVHEIFKFQDMNVSARGDVVIHESLVFGSSSFMRAPYGDYWKFMKKFIMGELLGPQALERSHGLRAAELERFYRDLADKARKKQSVKIGEEARRFTSSTLGKSAIGTSFSEEEAARVSDLSAKFSALFLKFFVAQFLHKLLEKLGISLLKKEIMEVSHGFDALFERIAKRENKHPLLKETHENVTMDQIKALFAELFVGAADSVQTIIQWTMAEIINNPKILERLREEIDSVVGKNRLVQESDLPNLPYLRAVINESMRMHPLAPLLPRAFIQRCKIEGFDIHEDTILIVNAYDVMRDPNYWEDPNEFKPERFLVSSKSREQALAFIPFGVGRRGCPAANLAYILVGTAIGVMVQGFDWEIKGGEKVNLEEAAGIRLFSALAHPLECTPNLQIPNSCGRSSSSTLSY